MLTKAELRRMRWSSYWTEALARRLIDRLLNGRALQPRWLPRRVVTVLSADVDRAAGVGALWLVSRPWTGRAEDYNLQFERCGEEWQTSGGGSSTGADNVPRRRREPVGVPGSSG
ncbi:hypothetical protein [Streptacidiphilus sp. PAMC 29251]